MNFQHHSAVYGNYYRCIENMQYLFFVIKIT